jgi:hypothetical protein
MAEHRDEPDTQSNSESRELAKDEPQPLVTVDCRRSLGLWPGKNGTGWPAHSLQRDG